MMNNYTVYMHTNVFNNKVYIGLTKQIPEFRWQNGRGYVHNKHFYSAIKKYGWNDGFLHEILFEKLNHEEANNKEIELIKQHNSNNPDYGYNISSGGDGTVGCYKSIEIRAKMSLNRKGKYTGKNSYWFGKYRSEDTKLKISIKNKGKNSPWFNKKHNTITKNKISEKMKGTNNPYYDMFGKNHPTSKKVICLETEAIYDSLSIASKELNINIGNISSCCNGKIKFAGKLQNWTKLRWMYYEEYLKEKEINKDGK